MADVNISISFDTTQARDQADRLQDELEGVGRKSDQSGRRVTQLGRTIQTSMSRAAGAVGRLGSALFSLRGAILGIGVGILGREVVQAAQAFDRINNALRVATGGAENAAKEFKFVRSEVDRLGLDLEVTAQQYSQLAAASRGTALEGEQTREVFVAISEAASVLGLTAEQTGGALQAIQQIISKGRVSAEELRGQLGERLPGAFQIAARSIGKTTAELSKMLEEGKLAAEDLLPNLARELRKTFGPEVEAAAQDTTSQINRFKTALFEIKLLFAQSGFLDGLTAALKQIAETMKDESFQKGLKDFSKFLGDTMVYMVENASTIKDVALALGAAFVGAQAGRAIGGARGGAIGALVGGGAALVKIEADARAAEERAQELAIAIETVQANLEKAAGIDNNFAGITTALKQAYENLELLESGDTEEIFKKLRIPDETQEGIEKYKASLLLTIEALETLKKAASDRLGSTSRGPDDGTRTTAPKPFTETVDPEDLAKELAKAQAAFDSFASSLDPAYAAMIKFDEGMKIIQDGLKRGFITDEQADRFSNLLVDDLTGAADKLKEIKDAIEDTRTPLEEYQNKIQEIDELKFWITTEQGLRQLAEAGLDAADVMDALGRAGNQAGEELKDALDETNTFMEDLKDSAGDFASVIGTAFEDAVLAGKDLRGVMAGLLDDIARILLRVSVTKPLENFFTAALGGATGGVGSGVPGTAGAGGGGFNLFNVIFGGIGSLLGGLFADGGTFSAGKQVRAFAKGGVGGAQGVYNSPTYFPMAQGNIGLLGEAGPEAIMPLSNRGGQYAVGTPGGGELPLTRLSSGKLGVDPTRAFADGGVFGGPGIEQSGHVKPAFMGLLSAIFGGENGPLGGFLGKLLGSGGVLPGLLGFAQESFAGGGIMDLLGKGQAGGGVKDLLGKGQPQQAGAGGGAMEGMFALPGMLQELMKSVQSTGQLDMNAIMGLLSGARGGGGQGSDRAFADGGVMAVGPGMNQSGFVKPGFFGFLLPLLTLLPSLFSGAGALFGGAALAGGTAAAAAGGTAAAAGGTGLLGGLFGASGLFGSLFSGIGSLFTGGGLGVGLLSGAGAVGPNAAAAAAINASSGGLLGLFGTAGPLGFLGGLLKGALPGGLFALLGLLLGDDPDSGLPSDGTRSPYRLGSGGQPFPNAFGNIMVPAFHGGTSFAFAEGAAGLRRMDDINSGEFLAVLRNGEQVSNPQAGQEAVPPGLPSERRGGGGDTFNFNFPGVTDYQGFEQNKRRFGSQMHQAARRHFAKE